MNRILFRFHYGLPMRQSSQDDREHIWTLMHELFTKWKSEGIKTIGTFICSSHPEGYSHFHILEVDDIQKMFEMNMAVTL